MSILTTLALMTSAVVAKLHNPDVEITRLQAKIDDLEGQLTEAKTVAVILGRERDQLRVLVERYQGREDQQRPAGPDFSLHQITEETRLRLQAHLQAQQLMAMAMAQAQCNQAQQAQYQQQALGGQNFYGEGIPQMLGQQHNQLGAQMAGFCNCVPARHDMFLRRG
jgi:hypothetical protein